MVGRLDSLDTTPPVELDCTSSVTAPLAVVIRHVVGPIKPSKLAAAVGQTILAMIQPPAFLTIVTPVHLTILPAIFLPHISGPNPPRIISAPSAMTAAIPRSAVERAGAASRRT